MKIFFILSMLVTSVSLSAGQKNTSDKADNFSIHAFNSKKQNLKKPLELFDNIELAGKPLYIISSEKIIDLSGKKEFLFREFYKVNPVIDDDEDDYIIVLKELPFQFIKRSSTSYAVPIQFKIGDVLKILDEKLYFKATNAHFFGTLSESMDWRIDTSLNAAQELRKTDKVFGKFMDELSRCVKIRNAECLFKLDRPYLKNAAIQWTLHSDPKFCDKIRNGYTLGDEDFENTRNIIVNWDLYKEFAELKSPNIKSRLTISDFGEYSLLSVQLEGESPCNMNHKLWLEIRKTKEGKTNIEVHPMAGEG